MKLIFFKWHVILKDCLRCRGKDQIITETEMPEKANHEVRCGFPTRLIKALPPSRSNAPSQQEIHWYSTESLPNFAIRDVMSTPIYKNVS